MKTLVILFLVALCATVDADGIDPVAWGTLRDQSGAFGVIDADDAEFDQYFSAHGTATIEDRAIAEFNLPPFSAGSQYDLKLTITRNSGDTTIPLVYEVYAYEGDGNVASDDYTAGELFDAFMITDNAVGSFINIDVTDHLFELTLAQRQFAGYRITQVGDTPDGRSATLGGFFGEDPPVLHEVPEPSVLLLVLGVLGGMFLWRRG